MRKNYNVRKKCSKYFSFLFFLIQFLSFSLFSQQNGEQLFKTNCAACHLTGETKLVGPGLKGVNERRSREWILKWVKNSQELINNGDADAIALFEQNNKIPMPPQALSDEEIIAILSYIDTVNAKVVTPVTTVTTADEQKVISPDTSNHTISSSIIPYIIIGLIVIFIVLIFVLRKVKYSLAIKLAEQKGLTPPVKRGLSENIYIWMSGNKRWVAVGSIVVILILSKAGWDVLMGIGVHQNYQPQQPIQYSHKIHAGDNGIDCNYCHSSARHSRMAGIPSANVCMNCHVYIQKGTITGTTEIAKIYEAMDYDPVTQIYGDSIKPIQWVRIHNLPDLTYFNHSQHVTVGQIKCQECHGEIQTMEVVKQFAPLTMGWCVDCHKKTNVLMDGNPYYEDLHKQLSEKFKGQTFTVDKIGGLECGKCHY